MEIVESACLFEEPLGTSGYFVDFLVELDAQLVGVVARVERDEEGGAPLLCISDGWLGRRTLRLPLSQVWAVDHAGRWLFASSR